MKILKIILGVLLIFFLVLGCEMPGNSQHPGNPQHLPRFANNDEYALVTIVTNETAFGRSGAYGYIKAEDLDKYLSDEITKLIVLHPYQEEKAVIVNVSEIIKMQIR